MNEIWKEALLTIITTIIGAIATVVIYFLKAKIDNLKKQSNNELANKYMDMIVSTVEECVITTNQTYVDNLKAENLFDKDAQAIAFNKTKDAILDILSSEAKKYIESITNDRDQFLKMLIEAAVKRNK